MLALDICDWYLALALALVSGFLSQVHGETLDAGAWMDLVPGFWFSPTLL